MLNLGLTSCLCVTLFSMAASQLQLNTVIDFTHLYFAHSNVSICIQVQYDEEPFGHISHRVGDPTGKDNNHTLVWIILVVLHYIVAIKIDVKQSPGLECKITDIVFGK